MQARIQTGATVAALAIASGALVADWYPWLAWVLVGLAGLSLIAAFANRLPLLHMIPLVGEPQVSIVIAQKASPTDTPQDVMIQVGLYISRPFDDAVLEFFAPEDVDVWDVNEHGTPTHKGSLMLPSTEPLNPGAESSKHWARHAELRLGDGLLHFMLEVFEKPRTFNVRFRVSSPQLYRNRREQIFQVTVE
jgi:hypothetical protein